MWNRSSKQRRSALRRRTVQRLASGDAKRILGLVTWLIWTGRAHAIEVKEGAKA